MSQRKSCFAQFFYRVNSDQTVESICGFCFAASYPAADQAELRKWEKDHVCTERRQSLFPRAGDSRKQVRAFG